MRQISFIILLALSLMGEEECNGQTRKMDSLSGMFNSNRHDTLKVEAFFKYGEELEDSNPDSAMHFFLKGKKLAQQIGYYKGVAVSSSYMLIVLNNKGKYKEGLEIAKEAIVIYEKAGTPRDLAIGYTNIGSQWEYLSEYNLAAENYTKALKYATALGEKKFLRVILNNLASVTITIGNYAKGRDYAVKSLAYAREINDKYGIASSLYNIAEAENYLKNYHNALGHFTEVEYLGIETEDNILILDGMLGIAYSYNYLNEINIAKKYFDSVIVKANEIDAIQYIISASKGLAECYSKGGNFNEAIRVNNMGIKAAKSAGTRNELQDLLYQASTLQEKKGNATAALKLYKEAQVVRDSVFTDNNLKSIANIDAKYETVEKEAKIRLQQSEIKQRKTVNYLLGSGTVAIAILSFAGYKNYSNRKKIDELRIAELEKEKQLTATEAVLKGEEQERTRLAKDLHDGLGGMLSGVKFSLNNIRGDLVMTPDSTLAFERSVDMLDSSIQEMRRVAHNMMPEVLIKFGLNTALEEYCSDINKSGALKVNYQSIGLAGVAIEQTTSIIVYRIIQELLNNAIKHANATSALVQLNKTEDALSVTVEDNGKGFDTAILGKVEGIGWTNIQHRIDFLKGKLDVQSGEGNGTFVHIEISNK